MRWDDFRIFLAVAETGSLREAAHQLKVDHSTVSRRITAFEQRARAKLLVRLSTGYKLTAAGEEIARSATRMRSEVLAVDRNAFGQDDLLTGEVKLTLPPFLAAHLLIPDLNAFYERFPLIDLVIPFHCQPLDLNRREADVALRLTKGPQENLIGRKIARYASALYGSADYLERTNVRSDEVVFIDGHHGSHATNWAAEIGRSGSSSSFRRIDDCGVRLETIRSGVGVGMLPCFAGDRDLMLRRVDDFEPIFQFDLWILTHPDLRKAARIRALIDHLTQALRGHRELLEGGRPRRVDHSASRRIQARDPPRSGTLITH